MPVSLLQLQELTAKYGKPSPIPSPTEVTAGGGGYTHEKLASLVELWERHNPGFVATAGRTSNGAGFHFVCPGTSGWADGVTHSNDGGGLACVWVSTDGWPRFSCRHSHCSEGSTSGKRTWKHIEAELDPGGRWQREVLTGVRQSAAQNPPNPGVLSEQYSATLTNILRKESNSATSTLQSLEPIVSASQNSPQPIEGLRIRPFTDMGNAERFVGYFGEAFRHTGARGWHSWDGKRWVPEARAAVVRASMVTVRAIPDEAACSPDPDVQKGIKKWGRASESKTRVDALLGLAQASEKIAVNVNQFDQDDWLLNVQNVTVNLKTGKLQPHSRGDLITAISPVSYNPSAKCPQWKAFLGRTLEGDQDMIDFLARAVGYTLTGSNTEQCFFINFGSGANGKSTFTETIKHIMGSYATATPMTTFMDKKNPGIPNDLAALRSARLVLASEAERTTRLAESLVKSLTGGESIAARFLHSEFFEFIPKFKIWLGTNHRPQILGTDDGIWRRVNLIKWGVKISAEERDMKLSAKLLEEGDGILQWALEGLAQYLKTGLGVPSKVLAATMEYREAEDSLGRFISDTCVVENIHEVPVADLYLQYKNWAEGGRERPLMQKLFRVEMERKGFEYHRSKQTRVYRGLKFRNP